MILFYRNKRNRLNYNSSERKKTLLYLRKLIISCLGIFSEIRQIPSNLFLQLDRDMLPPLMT